MKFFLLLGSTLGHCASFSQLLSPSCSFFIIILYLIHFFPLFFSACVILPSNPPLLIISLFSLHSNHADHIFACHNNRHHPVSFMPLRPSLPFVHLSARPERRRRENQVHYPCTRSVFLRDVLDNDEGDYLFHALAFPSLTHTHTHTTHAGDGLCEASDFFSLFSFFPTE